MKKCNLCGYAVHKTDRYTKFKGKTAHVSCLEFWIQSRVKTARMLNVPENKIHEWVQS